MTTEGLAHLEGEPVEVLASGTRTYYGSLNLTGKPIDMTPTLRVMPYTGKTVDIGEPDLNAGNGCKDRKRNGS